MILHIVATGVNPIPRIAVLEFLLFSYTFLAYSSGILTISFMILFCLSLTYSLGLMGDHLVGFGSMAASSAA